MSGMTARERSDLQQLARMNARVAKADVDAVVADRVAAFERDLQKVSSAQELQVEKLIAEANAKVAEINAVIEQQCDELGVMPELRPQMLGGFMGRARLSREREAEMRRLAKAELEAAGKRAKVEIDRQTAGVCSEIITSGLSTDEARSILGRVAEPEALVPSLEVAEVQALAQGGGRR